MANLTKGSGSLFLFPRTVDRTMKLQTGLTLIANRQSGVVVANEEDGPLSNATVDIIATSIEDEEGKEVGSSKLLEFIDPAGNIAWAFGYNKTVDGHAVYQLKTGIEKWKGITGEIKEIGPTMKRADECASIGYELTWTTDVKEENLPEYPNYDTGYSFHGAHVKMTEKSLDSGYQLVVSTQQGVLLSENADSPRHHATCYDRGTTILSSDGDVLGDVMLLEDTDAAGNITWLYHEWWYTGSGIYRFIGGTGKFDGIEGSGDTLGMVAERADDHYMPSWELRWKIKT